MKEKELIKLITKNKHAIEENILKSVNIEFIKKELLGFLNENLKKESILYLRYEKLKTDKKLKTLWSNEDEYPLEGAKKYLQPWIDIFEQYLGSKTIKKRLENEDYWIETRTHGEDEHIFVGKRNGTKDKAHIIIDGRTGEIRTEDNQQAPEEVLNHIEAILTLPNGRRIRYTRESLEEILTDNIFRFKNAEIEKAAKSIDAFGRLLMSKFGTKPEGNRHFNTERMSIEQKMSVTRLVDLNILKFESESKQYGFDYAYHWTSLGYAVMEYLGIRKKEDKN